MITSWGNARRQARRAMQGLLALTSLAVLLAAAAAWAFHITALPVLTNSMQPAYGRGDLVVTRPIAVRDLRPGMIISVVPPGETHAFVHRIAGASGDVTHPTVTTKGDANPTADGWRTTLATSSVPQVVAVVPRAGALPLALASPRGHALALSLLGLLLTLCGAVRIVTLTRPTLPPITPTSPVM